MFPELSTAVWVLIALGAIVSIVLFLRSRTADELTVEIEALLPLINELSQAEEGAWMSVIFMPGGQLDFSIEGKGEMAMTFAINEPDQQANKIAAIEAYKKLGLDVLESERNGFKFLNCVLPVEPTNITENAKSIIVRLRGDTSDPLWVIPEGFNYQRVLERVGT